MLPIIQSATEGKGEIETAVKIEASGKSIAEAITALVDPGKVVDKLSTEFLLAELQESFVKQGKIGRILPFAEAWYAVYSHTLRK
jgi:hypothetical protein